MRMGEGGEEEDWEGVEDGKEDGDKDVGKT